MNDSSFDILLIITLCIIAAFILGFPIGYTLGLSDGQIRERQIAIKAGVAKYTVDEKTGQTKFEYISPVELPKETKTK